MRFRPTPLPTALTWGALWLVAAPTAFAQIDLPKKARADAKRSATQGDETPKPKAGPEAAPVGAPRGEKPDVERSEPLVDELGRQKGTVTSRVYNGDDPGVVGIDPNSRRSSTGRQASGGGLDLPSAPRGRRTSGEPAPSGVALPGPAADARPAAPSTTETAGDLETVDDIDVSELRPAVRLVVGQLAEVERVGDPIVADSARLLAESGDDGLVAARMALDSLHGPTFLAGARALLLGGLGEDADRVVRAVQRRMPGRSAAGAVRSLVELDPVRTTPELLAELLRHPQSAVRIEAHRALEQRMESVSLPLLVPALEHRSSDVRERAVDLVRRVNHEAAFDLLLDRIDDSNPGVARKAIDAVARHDRNGAAEVLLGIAFEDPLPMRRQAMAWLAVVEREDDRLEPIFSERHVPALLRALESSMPLVSGSAATALSGIGFRSADPAATAWLDDEVPTRLVSVAAGVEFFDDFDTLRPIALRRLRQLSGENFGGYGAEWARWWLESEDAFRAARAVLPVGPADERSLRIAFRGADSYGPFMLLGPDLAGRPLTADESRGGEPVWLNEAEARSFVQLLRDEGALGFDRLPGSRGALGLGVRALEIHTLDASKVFRFGAGRGEPWFDRLLDAAAALRERNAWQRFPHPDQHVDRRGLFLAEREWWAAERTQAERNERQEALLLSYVEAVAPEERSEGLVALERLHAKEGVASRDDVAPLLALLDQEPSYGVRAARIVALVRGAAEIDDGAPDGTDEPDAASVEAARKAAVTDELIAILHDRFGPYAAEDIASLLLTRGREHVRATARDESSLLRGIAATVLGRDTEGEDVPVLVGLLEDPDPDVQVAALLSVGRAKVVEARDEVVLRAAFGEGAVRASALRALGDLGGDDALDVLLRGLTSSDPLYHVPAADGLAALGTPEAIPYLMSMLRNGRRSDTFEAARIGLLAQGSEAWDELVLAVRSPSRELRREASLLLAQQRNPQGTSGLIRALAEDPDDKTVAFELAVLSCVDQRQSVDPPEAWYQWWDEVDRRSPLSWFRAACVARGLTPPGDEAFVGEGTREAREFLLALIVNGDELWLIERARRELSALAGRDLGEVPADADARREWAALAGESLLAD